MKAARMSQPGAPDGTGPGPVLTFPGPAWGEGTAGELSGSGVAGTEAGGAEVAAGDGAEATGLGLVLT